MSKLLTQSGTKLAVGLLLTAAVGGCAHHRHREEVTAAVGVTEPVYIDGVAVIDDPDPFIVERERFYLRHPHHIRIKDDVVYYRGERIHDGREARAIRLAAQAREAHHAALQRDPAHARQVREEQIANERAADHMANRESSCGTSDAAMTPNS